MEAYVNLMLLTHLHRLDIILELLRMKSRTVDSPVMELLSDTVASEYNRIFLFDREQYMDLLPYNPDNIFYLPLATNCSRWRKLINTTSLTEHNRWRSDISFVGSLYTEKCPFNSLTNPPEYLSGYLQGIMEAQKNIYGYFFLDELLPDSIIKEFIAHTPGYYTPPELSRKDDRKLIALNYLGMKVTSMEISLLAKIWIHTEA